METWVYMTHIVIKREILSETLTMLVTCLTYIQKQTMHEHCSSTEVIAPSLPLKSDMDALFKPPTLLLAGLILPPQWWIRGIRNPSICMANYL